MLRLRAIVEIFFINVLAFGVGVAVAQDDYPSKPIRIIAPLPGGGTDFLARVIGEGISGPLGQPVIVENRPAIMTAELTTKAQPNGYTLLVTGGSLWNRPLLQKTEFDPVKDFAPITMIQIASNVVVVHPSVPATSIKELIALAKAKPGVLNYVSANPGSSTHLTGELFNHMAGVKITGVPYKSVGLGLTDLLGGQVQVAFSTASGVWPYIKSGKLRALAITASRPSALAPGIPTVASAGLPGYEAEFYDFMLAPAKTPTSIITRLNRETVRFLNQPEVKQKFLDTGGEVFTSTPQEYTAIMLANIAKWRKVINDAGIKADN